MFALNIMRKTCYDEVTAYCWTGSTDEFRVDIVLLSVSYTFAKFLVIAYCILCEHSITPLS